MLSACSGSFNSRYRSAFSSAAATAAGRISLSAGRSDISLLLGRVRRFLGERLRAHRLTTDLAQEPRDRIVVAIDDALLERDDAVVGDVDMLGAHLGAAARNVAHARPELLLQLGDAIIGIERVHFQAGNADHEARPDELALGAAVAQDVAHVLAEEALDALAELLHAIDVFL